MDSPAFSLADLLLHLRWPVLSRRFSMPSAPAAAGPEEVSSWVLLRIFCSAAGISGLRVQSLFDELLQARRPEKQRCLLSSVTGSVTVLYFQLLLP
jgi:hypothetical protein